MSSTGYYPEGAENDPRAPWNEVDVDYLGRAVSPEEFEEEDTRILCAGCGQVEVRAEGDRCVECLIARGEYLKD